MQINIVNSGQILHVEEGANLYHTLAQAGLIDGACGGKGICGKCRIRRVDNPPLPQQQETKVLTAAELDAGWRLACLQRVKSDFTIEIPPQDSNTAEKNIRCEITSFAQDFSIEIPPQSSAPPKQVFGRENILAEPGFREENAPGYGLALDIGTTTLAAALVNMEDGAVLASSTCLNSQKAYGQDVISRIAYAQSKPIATTELQAALIGDIKNLLGDICLSSSLHSTDITFAAIAANPTMTHLLAGINPGPLGIAPYTMVCPGPLWLLGRELGLPLAEDAAVYCIPAAAPYLGGDIIGGILATGLHQPGSTRLFIDIGTNGEIVLAQGGKLYACSTAAGPALEGMNISCGMRAAAGAIDNVFITGVAVNFTTIGGIKPRGLAGSGLLAAINALLEAGLLDRKGRLQNREPIREYQGKRCLIIDEASQIMLTQADIRQTQLAKGAIRAGINALLEAIGCRAQDIEEVLVAGGFGSHLPEQSLLGAGLLPREFAGKIHYGGNTSLMGAILCLLNPAMRENAAQVAAMVDFMDLALLPSYQQHFFGAMAFD